MSTNESRLEALRHFESLGLPGMSEPDQVFTRESRDILVQSAAKAAILIVGSSGIGKTRLMHEIAQEATILDRPYLGIDASELTTPDAITSVQRRIESFSDREGLMGTIGIDHLDQHLVGSHNAAMNAARLSFMSMVLPVEGERANTEPRVIATTQGRQAELSKGGEVEFSPPTLNESFTADQQYRFLGIIKPVASYRILRDSKYQFEPADTVQILELLNKLPEGTYRAAQRVAATGDWKFLVEQTAKPKTSTAQQEPAPEKDAGVPDKLAIINEAFYAIYGPNTARNTAHLGETSSS